MLPFHVLILLKCNMIHSHKCKLLYQKELYQVQGCNMIRVPLKFFMKQKNVNLGETLILKNTDQRIVA